MVGIHGILRADVVEQSILDPIADVQALTLAFCWRCVYARTQQEFFAGFFAAFIQARADILYEICHEVCAFGSMVRGKVSRVSKTQFHTVNVKSAGDFFYNAISEFSNFPMGEIECFWFLVVLSRARVVQSQVGIGFDIFGNADALFAVVCGVAVIYAEASDKLHAAPVRLVDEDVQGLCARFD